MLGICHPAKSVILISQKLVNRFEPFVCLGKRFDIVAESWEQ